MHKVFVRFIDGVEVYIPIDAKVVSENTFELLDNIEFDYKDDSVLFEFGKGDIVIGEVQKLEDEDKLVAKELIKTSSKDNEYKRLLFVILTDNPKPSKVVKNFSKLAVLKILNENKLIYPGLKDWVKKNKSSLKIMLN